MAAGDPLTEQERDLLKRMLASPLEFPPPFKTWILDCMRGASGDITSDVIRSGSLPRSLGKDTSVVATTSAAEKEVYTKLIPANMLNANGKLIVEHWYQVVTSETSGSVLTVRYKANGTTFYSFTEGTDIGTGTFQRYHKIELVNTGSRSAQLGVAQGTSLPLNVLSTAIDFSAEVTFSITLQRGGGSVVGTKKFVSMLAENAVDAD